MSQGTGIGARRQSRWIVSATVVSALLAGGCAIGNKGELEFSRHVSIGQELIDLKRARDEGAISAEEYAALKAKIMELADSVEIVDVVNEATPDEIKAQMED